MMLNLLVDHEAKDAHHGGTAVVELDGTLGELGLLIEVVPDEVDVAVAEVAHELVAGSFDIAHEGAFQHSNEGNELYESGGGDGVRSDEGGDAIGEGVKGVAGVVDVAGKVESSAGGDLPEEGQLTDAAVLDLHVTEPVEALLSDVAVERAERIVEAERRLGAELVLKGADGHGGLGRGGGGVRGGGAHEGGEDDRLHDRIGN
jgi:nucleotide-binding universal stress UspA family protein